MKSSGSPDVNTPYNNRSESDQLKRWRALLLAPHAERYVQQNM